MLQVQPSMPAWSTLSSGQLQVQELTDANVRIVSSALAQTVNLQYFEAEVDRMYEIVNELNDGLERQDYAHLESKSLYQNLARINTITNAVVLSGLRTTYVTSCCVR